MMNGPVIDDVPCHQRRRWLAGVSWALVSGFGAAGGRLASAANPTPLEAAADALANALPDDRAVQALRHQLQARGHMDPGRITLRAPVLAENGAHVPVSVDSAIEGTTTLTIYVDTNPVPLAARFEIPQGTEAFASMRVKMAQSGRIYAVVEAGGETYWRFIETKVVVGGCG